MASNLEVQLHPEFWLGFPAPQLTKKPVETTPMISKTLKSAALAAVVLVSGPAAAQDLVGDPVKGERVFRKCKTCHAMDQTRATGPLLGTVIGRVPGTIEGFRNYSKAMIAYGEEGAIWTAETLDPYLEKPRAVIKRGTMAFPGLRKPQDRADVIAYIVANQLDAPAPAAEAGAE